MQIRRFRVQMITTVLSTVLLSYFLTNCKSTFGQGRSDQNSATMPLAQSLPTTNNRDRLPAWFNDNRVQAHTRLVDNPWASAPILGVETENFKRLGDRVFVRWVASAKGPLWPSKVTIPSTGEVIQSTSPNYVKRMIDEAHGKGLHIIGYSWMSTDESIEKRHPEWLCKTPDGKPSPHTKRGNYLDITSEYREVVLQRLMQLAEMGLDGYYFDESHLPYAGCWGSAFQKSYEKETGRPAPTAIDDRDPSYLQYMQYQSRQLEKTFAYWRSKVHERYPGKVFIVSAQSVGALVNPRMSTRQVAISDSPKSEVFLALNSRSNLRLFNSNSGLAKPDNVDRITLAWTLMRDSADGRPPHLWAPGFPNQDHALAFASAVMTYGAIANMDVTEAQLQKGASPPVTVPKKGAGTPEEALKATFALGNQVSPYLSPAMPLRWAAVHYSEQSRDRRGTDYIKAWQDVLWPLTGAFGVLSRQQVPVGVINDTQLEQPGGLQGYKLLFLSNPTELNGAQQRNVDAFRQQGGIVLANNPSWKWSTPGQTKTAEGAFLASLQPYLPNAPVQVKGGPATMRSVAYRNPSNGQTLIAITNDFSWIQFQQGKNLTVRNAEDIVQKRKPGAAKNKLKKGKKNKSDDSLLSEKNIVGNTTSNAFEDDLENSDLSSSRRGMVASSAAPVQGINVLIKTSTAPKRVFDAVSGQTLTAKVVSGGGGGYTVQVPPFKHMALIVTE